MKRSFIVLFAIALLCSCIEPSLPEDTGTVLTVSFDSSCYATWNSTDSICVNGVFSHPACEISRDGLTATFKYDTKLSAPYFVVYGPSDSDSGLDTQHFIESAPDPAFRRFTGSGQTEEITISDTHSYVSVAILQGASETLTAIRITDLSSVHFSAIDIVSPIAYTSGRLNAVVTIPAGTYSEGFSLTAFTSDGDAMELSFFDESYQCEAGSTLALSAVTFSKAAAILGGGSGLESDPYLISSLSDFNAFAALLDGTSAQKYSRMYYLQTADVDFGAASSLSSVCADASVPFRGRYDGGGNKIIAWHGSNPVFGHLSGELCNLEFTSVTINSANGNVGVVASTINDGIVSNVRISGEINAEGPNVGSVAGTVSGSSSVSGIVSKVDVSSSSYNVGGIVGYAETESAIHFDKSVGYNKVAGLYNVGGIVGFSNASGQGEVAMTNCLCATEELEATGNFYDSSDWETYCNVGGIVGKIVNADATSSHKILNCSSVLFVVRYPMTYGGEYSTKPCIGGIFGLQTGPGTSSCVEGCWSALPLHGIERTDINLAYAVDNNNPDIHPYGGIFGMENGMTYKRCYWMDSTKMGLNL